MALGALGAANYYQHNRAEGERYFAAALARSERLTELERLLLLRRLATFRGNIDSSLVVSARIAERFPSVTTWADYATDLMNAGRLEEAIAAFGRAIAIDSTAVLPWFNLATTHARMRQHELAVQSYARVGALDSAALYRNNINHEYGQELVYVGRPADAETLYSRMADGPRIQDRALGLRSLGYLYYWEGRLDESADAFARATSATQQMKAPLSEGRNHLLLAMAYRAANRRADADAEITRALALDTASTFEPTMLALVAYACQQSARARDVESVITLLRTRVDTQNRRDRSAAAFAEATLRMVRRQPDSALVYLRRASDFPFGGPRVMLMASAFDAVHQPDSAKTVLRTLIDASAFGVEGQAEQMHAPLVLGDLFLQSADTAAAVQRYKEVAVRWRNAPVDAPDLVAAKTRLLALKFRAER
jgi:tetratricopeptide (TPR) repeat protein